MKKTKCCGKTSFELLEEEVIDDAHRTHVVLCVHCGKVMDTHRICCVHLRLSKVAHKLGFDLEK